ncbi:MAG TPA: V-type ATP synthase subunit B [Treponemataceae bacterium]|nr:V-type ATP synthase subunit B [Treponemataceae bacterium]
MRGVEYRGAQEVEGPILVVRRSENVFYNEIVCVRDRNGAKTTGRVIDLDKDYAVIQVFGSTNGLDLDETTIEFLDTPMELRVGNGLLGRIFNGLGEPIDGYSNITSSTKIDVNGYPINPYARVYPRDFIQTGLSAIDGINTLIRGQKLPIFSGNGLPHNKLAAQIIRQARILSSDEEFVMVFAGMGIKYDEAQFFVNSFEDSGVLSKVVMFQSLADAPSIERIITPRCALTAAEYLAYEQGKHVLVVLTDMTNYCEALREISTTRGEIPGRKGYPGYMYSDLAELYERAGRIKGSKGSITQIPILTMPNDDISNPIPDLTGYITEGQIVLDRELSQKGLYPPVAGLPSLSRLMKDGIGEGMTREDHKSVSSQVFAAYSKVKSIRNLASIIGEEELSEADKKYLSFGDRFENEFLAQDEYENRSIEQTLSIGWDILQELPQEELYRLKPEYIEKYMKKEE